MPFRDRSASVSAPQAASVLVPVILFTIFSIAFLVFLRLYALPWISPHIPNDNNTAVYAHYARNIVRYGFDQTRFLMADLVGASGQSLMSGFDAEILRYPDANQVKFYYTHSPVLAVLTAGFFHLIGSEIQVARLPSVLASVGSLIVLCAWLWRRFGPASSCIALLATASMPIFWRHGIVLNFEPLVTLLMIVSVLAFAEWLDSRSRPAAAVAVVFWVLAMMADWPGYFLALPFLVGALIRRSMAMMLVALLLPVATLLSVMGYQASMAGDLEYPVRFVLGSMRPLYDPAGMAHYQGWGYVLERVLLFARGNFGGFLAGWGLLNLSLLVVATVGRDLRIFVAAAFLFATVMNVAAFKLWAGEHNFWTYYAWPAFAVSMSAIPQILDRAAKSVRAPRVVATTVLSLAAVLLFLVAARTYWFLIAGAPPPIPPSALEFASGAKQGELVAVSPRMYMGHAYAARWYIDQPLKDGGRPHELTCDPDRTWIIMAPAEAERLPELFAEAFERLDLFGWDVASARRIGANTPDACRGAVDRVLGGQNVR